jgi:hypothetical protein
MMTVINNLDAKDGVRVATAAPVVLEGLLTVDGVALNQGDRVLVKDQIDASENGIWRAVPGRWSRAVDAQNSNRISSALNVVVTEGATNAGTAWVLTNQNPVSVGTDPLNFIQITGGGGGGAPAGETKVISIRGGANDFSMGGPPGPPAPLSWTGANDSDEDAAVLTGDVAGNGIEIISAPAPLKRAFIVFESEILDNTGQNRTIYLAKNNSTNEVDGTLLQKEYLFLGTGSTVNITLTAYDLNPQVGDVYNLMFGPTGGNLPGLGVQESKMSVELSY